MDRRITRVCILVKAYPQPSERYEETVCVAGVEVDTGHFLRLYPVPYRRLTGEQQFDRYDVIEVEAWRDASDPRTESHKVNPDSIRIVQKRDAVKAVSRIEAWARSVTPCIKELEDRCAPEKISLGIVPVDAGSMKLDWVQAQSDEGDDPGLTEWITKQGQLLNEAPLRPLPVDYSFFLTFTSCGLKRRKRLMDWEAQATYWSFRDRYGEGALQKMKETYEGKIANENPHLFLGTMKVRPFLGFVLIGVLRSSIPPATASKQGQLGF